MKLPPVAAKTVLITGCSSGIGAATARVLRGRGWTVFPTARKETDLAALRADGFTAVGLDLADEESVTRAVAELLRQTGGTLGALVNNAGMAQSGALEDLSRAAMRDQMEVNVLGLQDLTNRLVPVMRRQGCGRIVNVSSVLGRVSTPMVGMYCASKFAVEALSDALRVELHGSGVGVIVIEPGPIDSAFRRNAADRAAATLDLEHTRLRQHYRREIERRRSGGRRSAGSFARSPEAVAAKIVQALESPHPRRRYCVTVPAYLGAFLARFAPPAWLDAALARRLPKA